MLCTVKRKTVVYDDEIKIKRSTRHNLIRLTISSLRGKKDECSQERVGGEKKVDRTAFCCENVSIHKR